MAKESGFNKMVKENSSLLLITAIVSGGYYFVVKPLLETVGLKDSSEDKRYKKNRTAYDLTAFNPAFLNKAPKGSGIYDSKTGKSLAKRIYDAKGFFNDDESKVYAVFKTFKAKSDVATVAFYFVQQYGKDMHSYMSFLSQSEMEKIYIYITSMPDYRRAVKPTSSTTQKKVQAATKQVSKKYKMFDTGKI